MNGFRSLGFLSYCFGRSIGSRLSGCGYITIPKRSAYYANRWGLRLAVRVWQWASRIGLAWRWQPSPGRGGQGCQAPLSVARSALENFG